jgi:hypothetical protein
MEIRKIASFIKFPIISVGAGSRSSSQETAQLNNVLPDITRNYGRKKFIRTCC